MSLRPILLFQVFFNESTFFLTFKILNYEKVFYSCSDDSFENDELGDNSSVIELRQNEDQSFNNANEIVTETASFGINWCIQKCAVERKECFDWASENRHYRLLDCENIRIIGTEMVDVYCEETVIIGYDYVEVYSPEGELIRIDEVPIYGTELVVCGQEEQNIYSTDPDVLQEYEDCRLQAQIEFVDAVDDCDIKYIECEEKCRKPKPNDNGNNDDDEDPE